MTKQQQTQEAINKLMNGDPWADSNLDLSSLSLATREKLGLGNVAEDDSDGVDTHLTDLGPRNLRAMLENPSPEMLDALAESDPTIRARLAEENAERTNLEFRKAHPNYLKTSRNFRSLVLEMASEHLGVDHLSVDEAYAQLCESGKWTLPNLGTAFKKLSAAGRLDVPRGTARELTKQEKLQVIATIRSWDVSAAIGMYMHLSIGTPANPWTTPEDLLAQYPEVANRAAAFCFLHAHTESIDPERFREFLRTKMGGRPLWTVEILNSAWAAYQREPTNARTETAPSVELDSLADSDFEALRLAAFSEHRKQRQQ